MAVQDRVQRIIELARETAAADPDFQSVKGAGAGDRATARFLAALRMRVLEDLGTECSEKRICGPTSYAVDFFLEEEETVVEVALGLPNPSSEYEKDILKAIIAQDYFPVRRLVLISRAGGEQKCRQPGRAAVREWARTKHGLAIEVFDLGGTARRRKRAGRPTRPDG